MKPAPAGPPEDHYNIRSGWLRAAVLGANDGILSVASVVIGVAAASATREPVLLAGVAALVAGALSMAAGEYVSVSSQVDIETGDLARERLELETDPAGELRELAGMYQAQGLRPDTALEVARQLTAHDALAAHARVELGINEITQAKPLQAAFASGAAFVGGGFLPVLAAYLLPLHYMVWAQYALSLLFLAVLGAVAARAGGAQVGASVARITFWGTVAMGVTAAVGWWFGVSVG